MNNKSMDTVQTEELLTPTSKHTERYHRIFAGLIAVFVTFVVLTNTVGVKLFTVFGNTLPVSILWYPLTFLVTDIVSEMFGAKRARFLVVMGFSMSVLLLTFSLIGIRLPVAEFYPLQEDYAISSALFGDYFSAPWPHICSRK